MLRLLLSIFFLAFLHLASSQNEESCPPGLTRFCGCDRFCADGDFRNITCPGGCTPGCYCQFPMFQSNVNVGQCLSVSECLLENAASVILPGGIPALGPNVGVTEGERVLGRGQDCVGNRVFTQCARCEIFCVQRNNPPECFEPCRVDCFCPPGFVVDFLTGECIPPQLCPVDPPTQPPITFPPTPTFPSGVTDPFVPGRRRCTSNEVPSNCVRCERTCQNRLLNLPCRSDEPCRVGCACRDGLIRFGDDCVYVNGCPLEGADDLTFCGRTCPEGTSCQRRGAIFTCV